jgi:hypothetical protein
VIDFKVGQSCDEPQQNFASRSCGS